MSAPLVPYPLKLQRRLPPDLSEARRFLHALDPRPDARFGLATFDDDHMRSDYRLAGRIYSDGDLRQCGRLTGRRKGVPCSPANLLSFRQHLGAGVFVTVQELDGHGASEQHVVGIRAFFADADDDTQLGNLQRFARKSGLMPSILVVSGGFTHSGNNKIQAYWLIDGCEVSAFAECQALLLSRTGTDPTVRDLARVFRLPGFYHQKKAPRMTCVIALTGRIYDCSKFVACVRSQTQVQNMAALSSRHRRGGVGHHAWVPKQGGARERTERLRILLERTGGIVTPAVKQLIHEATAPADSEPGCRHATLVTVVARLAGLGWPDASIRQVVLPLANAAWSDGDWGEHLDQVVAWVRGKQTASDEAIAATRTGWFRRPNIFGGPL